MKSIAGMAKDLNISSPTIREYLSRFDQLSERLGRLITTIENLTSAITGANVETFKGIRRQVGSHKKSWLQIDLETEKNPARVLRK